jgi:ubiquinone/menaquinone biosynthesis C-methylase UbiE
MSHDKIAETFDRWVAEGRDAGLEEEHKDVVIQVIGKLEIRPGERILDLGCGNGWATRLLAQTNAGVQAIGVDASTKMIERAESLHSLTIRARYEVGKFEELDFKDAHFDRVFSMEALYYAADLERALAECFRVTKPGGRVDVLVNYFEESPASHGWADALKLPLHRLDEAGWRGAFEKAGFSGLETARVIDSRGPGAAHSGSEFQPTDAARQSLHESGSLWIRGIRP